jgi:WD40 repeat protein
VTHKCGKENLLDLTWSQDGNKLAFPSKDKQLHLLDIRTDTESWTVDNSPGLRGGRAAFYDKFNYIVTTGYSSTAARQIIVRDIRKPESPVVKKDVDFNTGVLAPFIDEDTGVLFTFGRDDTTSKSYELPNDDTPLCSQ